MKTFLCCTVACAALLMAGAPCALAQQYPAKPIRLLVGFAAYINAEMMKWSKVIKAAGIRVD